MRIACQRLKHGNGIYILMEEWFCHPYGCGPDRRVIIPVNLLQEIQVNRVQSLDCPESMKPCKRVSSARGQLPQVGKHRPVTFQNDQFLGFVPPPSVRVGEVLDQFSGRLVEHDGAWPGPEGRVADPVNPSTLDILVQTIVIDCTMNE